MTSIRTPKKTKPHKFDLYGPEARAQDETYLGTLKVLQRRAITGRPGADDKGFLQDFVLIKTAPGIKRREIKHALVEDLGSQGCSHTHDCCGCYFPIAQIVHADRRKITARVMWYRNV